MAKQKPGVMIYFDPIHKEVHRLDDQRVARLFRAILDHANPEWEEEPDLSDDEVLAHVWPFVESDVNRDDETYQRKVGNKYSAFCRYCKENGYGDFTQDGDYIPPLTRQEWNEAGQPTYKQWSASTLMTPNRETHTFDASAQRRMQSQASHTDAYERMQSQASHTDAYERMQSQASHTDAYERMQSQASQSAQKNARKRTSDTLSNSYSSSLSGSNPLSASGAEAPPDANASEAAAPPMLSPGILRDAYETWKSHWEETHREAMPTSTQDAMAEEMRQYAEEYNPYVVADFVKKCVSNGYKSLPWDKMEREQEAHYREMEKAAGQDRRWA